MKKERTEGGGAVWACDCGQRDRIPAPRSHQATGAYGREDLFARIRVRGGGEVMLEVDKPDDIPFERINELAKPYLGEIAGVYSDWTPLADRGWLLGEDVDRDDPWQFKNFRVT